MKNKAKPASLKKMKKVTSKLIQSRKTNNKPKPLSMSFMQSSLDAVNDAVCFLDTDQRILHCNQAMTEMFGLTQKEIVGKRCWEIVHSTKKPFPQCPTARAKKSLSRESGEIRKEGKCFRIIADPIVDKKGKIKGMVHTLQDITEHKCMIRSLKESNNKYRELLENLSEVIFSIDIQGTITYISPAMERLTGYSTKEIIGTNISKHILPEDLPIVLDSIKRILVRGKEEAVEYRVKIKNGEIRHVLSSSKIILKNKEPVGLTGIITDITQRKLAEEALKDTELKFRTIFESASDGILLADPVSKNFISANESICKMLDYSKEELLKLNVSDIHPQKSLSYVIDQFEKLSRKEISIARDIPVMRKNKTVFFADVTCSLIMLNDRECLVGIFRDTTQRKRSEEEIRESEYKYKLLTEKMSDIVWIMDLNLKTTYVSPSIQRVLGFSQEERLRQTVEEQLTPDSLSIARKILEDELALETKEKSDPQRTQTLILEFYHKDGSTRWLENTINGIRNEHGILTGLHGVSRDITERKLAEDILKERDIVFRKLSANVPGMIYQFKRTSEGKYSVPYTTEAIKDVFGCSPEDVTDDFSPISKVIYPDDLVKLMDSIEYSARNMSHWQCEFRVQIPGKPIKWLLGNSTPEKLPDGSIIWHGFCTDISERKQAEAALQERDAIFRKLSAHVPGAIYQFVRKPDGTFHLPFASDTIIKISGYTPQEVANDFSLATKAIVPEDIDGFISSIEYSARHMTEWKYEYRIQLPGKPVRWLMAHSSPEKLPDGSIIWYGYAADVTEQKETQENLKISQENYKRLFEDHSAVKLIIDPETGGILDANYAAAAFYGWTREEIKQMKIWQINTLSEDEINQEIDKALKMKKVHFEFRHRLADGSLRNVDVYSSKIKINGKDVLHSIIHDITERKQLEEALVKSELKFKRLFENSPVGVFMVKDRTFTDVNPALCNITGYSPEELIGQSVRIGYADDEEFQRAGSILYDQTAKTGVGSVETRCKRKNGEIFYALLFLSQIDPQDSSLGYECIMADIDETKRAEEKIKFEQQRFKSLTESSSDIILVLNTEGIVTYMNPAIEKVLGYKPEERIGKNAMDFVHSDDQQSMIDKFNILINSKKYSVLHDETRLRHKDGSWRVFETTGNNIIKDNVVEAVIVRQHDITARKLMEERLRLNEEKFRRITENMSGFVSELDPQGIFLYNSPSVSTILGFSPEELINRNAFDFVHPEDRDRVMEKYMEGIRTDSEKEVEQRYQCKDGKYIWLRSSGRPIYEPDGKNIGMVVNSIDITDRKKIEKDLFLIMKAVEGSSDAIGISDPQGYHFYQNKAFSDLFEYSTAEELQAAGGGPAAFANKEIADKVFSSIMNGKSWQGEIDIISKSGRILPVMIRADAIKDENGKIIALMGIHTDITERKRAEEALKRSEEDFRSLFEQSIDGIIINDQYSIIEANHAFCVMTGYPFEKIFGRKPLDFIHPDDRAIATQRLEQRQKGVQSPEGYIYRAIRADGSISFVDLRSKLIEWKGKPAFLTIIRDITEQSKAEEALRASEEKYRGIFDESIAAIYLFDLKKNFIDSNQAGFDLLGYTREELMKMSIQDVDVDPALVIPAHQRLFEGGRLVNYEHKLRRKDGNVITVLNNSRPLTDNTGNTIGMLSTLIDITERKNAENELQNTKDYAENLLKTANVMIVILDAEGNVNLLNEAGEKISGYSANEVIGKNWFELICPRERYTQVWNEFENLKKSGKIEDTFENPIMTKSGEERVISWKNSTIVKNDQFVGTLSFGIDITDRKHAEEALRESETKLKDAIQGSPIPQFVIDKKHTILYWNKALEEITGIKSADVLGTNRHWQAFYAQERPCLADLLVDEKTNLIPELYKGKSKKSNYAKGAYEGVDFFPSIGQEGKWLFFSAAPIRDTQGNIIAAIETLEDITERRKAEDDLRQTQILNEAIISSIPGLLYLYDDTGHLVHWNKQHEDLTGYTGEEIKNRYIMDWFGGIEPDSSNIRKGIEEVMTEGYGTAEGRLLTKDGKLIPMFFTGIKLNIAGKDHLLGIGIDMTERKKTEEELEKYRQHLEELVRERTIHLEASNKELEAFSYSASHDLRAPLRSIEGFSQALLEDYYDKFDAQGKDYLTRIKMATRRMADLIEDMLQLSRITRMEMNIEKIDLTSMAQSLISDLQKSQPQRNVKVIIAKGLQDKADLRLTRIVMENLLNNAWKFTEKQAKATIEFGLWKKEGEKSIYFIRDNGAGFDMAYADKLFAPFQRLHADDEFPGTGIGLATIRRILNRHGGKIWAEGETGKGATFYFCFS